MPATSTATRHVASLDGTHIAYEVRGTGPALVLVDGALCQRAMGPSAALAQELSDAFAVHLEGRVHPEHRGRGVGQAVLGWQLERGAEIHAVDWQAVGLDTLAKHSGYLERQVNRFLGLW